MGAGDHLVGISSYDDSSRPELKDLPKIGDYQAIDWERLRALKPQILIIFQSPDRISPGVKERAAKLNEDNAAAQANVVNPKEADEQNVSGM